MAVAVVNSRSSKSPFSSKNSAPFAPAASALSIWTSTPHVSSFMKIQPGAAPVPGMEPQGEAMGGKPSGGGSSTLISRKGNVPMTGWVKGPP